MRRFSMWKCPTIPTTQAADWWFSGIRGWSITSDSSSPPAAAFADLELDYGVEKSKVDSVRSRLFGALRPSYQERDRLRLLIQ